jgi:phospholipid/cholesterol/gamma-HCH transport system permease protein
MPKKESSNSAISGLQYHLTGHQLFLIDELVIGEVSTFLTDIQRKLHNYAYEELVVHLDDLTNIDSAGVTALEHLKDKLASKGVHVSFSGGSESVQNKMKLFASGLSSTSTAERPVSFLEDLGDKFYSFLTLSLGNYISIAAEIFYWSIRDLFSRKARRKGEVTNQAINIGVNAVPIVAALSFIIGLVLALQSAAQLRNFGANIFIVDLTVIAMMREMGPLITAILVAGRSGSAIAAEIATMKVTSELDALTTMGLNPIRFVVVPKMLGAVTTIPFLTILANVLGIMGGALVAYLYLDINPEMFYNRMGESLYIKDILTGFVKSIMFATIIVLTGSYYGYKVKEGAEGVGKVTTFAVVVAISQVIIIDSVLGLIFY